MRAAAAQVAVAASLIGSALSHGFHGLDPRGNTNCGPAYGNAVCDAGQCCSSAGVCGTGAACIAPDCLFQFGPGCDANQSPPGTNTTSIARPQFGNVPYGVTITQCTTPGKVALTFDDGPYLYTSDMLDLLKSNNIKATFFVVANNGGKGQIENDSTGYPALLRRMLSEGHQIGSHTWSHQDLSTLTSQQIMDQVIKNEIAFEDIFGFIPTYIRPPYGRCYGDCLSLLGRLGYHVVTWNLDTNDWKEDYPTSQATFSNAIKSSNPSKDSFIPLAHDIHYGTVHGFAQYMIDTLKAGGYTTALVGECLNDAPANWYRDASSGQQWAGASSQTSSSPPPPPPPAPTTSTSTSTSSTSTSTSSTSTSTSTTSTSTSTPTSSSTSSSTSTSTNTSSSSSSTTPTSSSTSHTSSSTATHSSVHPTTTIYPSFQHLNVTLSNGTTTTSSVGGCGTHVGACVLQGLGATAQTSTTSTVATTTTASTTLASNQHGTAAQLVGSSVCMLGAISMLAVLLT